MAGIIPIFGNSGAFSEGGNPSIAVFGAGLPGKVMTVVDPKSVTSSYTIPQNTYFATIGIEDAGKYSLTIDSTTRTVTVDNLNAAYAVSFDNGNPFGIVKHSQKGFVELPQNNSDFKIPLSGFTNESNMIAIIYAGSGNLYNTADQIADINLNYIQIKGSYCPLFYIVMEFY